MACKNVCKLCDRLILSQAVTFTAGTGLVINIPAGSYSDCEKYCIVVAQTIPTTTTVAANVVITIGDDTTAYPLLTPLAAISIVKGEVKKQSKISEFFSFVRKV